jgi:ribosomal protein L23
MEQVIPFAIGRAKKYDEETQTWVRYNNIKEYLECRYGKEVYNKAIEQGVYSEEEYQQARNRIEELYNKGRINEENKLKIDLMVDTYYGVKVLAVNCNINKELMSKVLDRLGNCYKELISGCIPVSNVKNCMSNHYGEIYLALLRTQGTAEKIN